MASLHPADLSSVTRLPDVLIRLCAWMTFAAATAPAMRTNAQPASDAALRPEATAFRFVGDDGFTAALPGSLLLHGRFMDAIPMGLADPDSGKSAGRIPPEFALRSRLRIAPSLSFAADPHDVFAIYALKLELDLIDAWGPVGRGRSSLAIDPSLHAETGSLGDMAEQVMVLAAGRHLSLAVGLMRSDWGMGLVANPGHDPVAHRENSPFGLPRRGDRVMRLAVSVTPHGDGLSRPRLSIRAAIDAVVDDDFARWADGDRTFQGIVAVSGRTDDIEAGFYAVHRSQRHAEGGDTEATVLDAYFRATLARENDFEAFIAAEVAFLFGRTDHLLSAQFDQSFKLQQGGGLIRFGVHRGPILALLEGGFTSGDEDPFDDTIRSFAMDRDHQVGLLMFPELIASATAGTHANLMDPAWRRSGPRGADQIATLGAVRGALYLNPRISVEITKDFVAYTGYVYAQQVGAWVDPFWSGFAGGAARGPRNGPPSDLLGHEVDVGLSLAVPLDDVRLTLRTEAAWCRPGGIFAAADGTPAADIWGFWVFAGIGW